MRAHRRSAAGTVIEQLCTSDGRVYQFIRTIATALMGKVKSAAECVQAADGSYFVPPDPTLVAIKQVYKYCVAHGVTTEGKRVLENPIQEAAIMARLNDPGCEHVFRLMHFLHDERCLYLVYEWCDEGELFHQVEARTRVAEAEAKDYLWQVLQGIIYLHAQGVTHRDLSLENAMINSMPKPGTIKIIDFGLAVMLPPLQQLAPSDGASTLALYLFPLYPSVLQPV